MLTYRFQEALHFCNDLHGDQLRKGGDVPYVAHLLGTASIVLEAGGSEDEAIAALLHDAIEDCGGEDVRPIIRDKFGLPVLDIVDGCTEERRQPELAWRVRKQAHLTKLELAGASVLLVAVADKLYNARAILRDYRIVGEKLWKRFTGNRDGILWYYRGLVTAFRHSGLAPRDLVDELDRVVTHLETWVSSDTAPIAEPDTGSFSVTILNEAHVR